ncbi:cdk10/11, putative [Acanthamoeba castellanii str. Neff]|uniref:Cdk10/11, putative n=1 Tax=Acanthamoeba castellanii (strain ATCC 30010 / Neff) TaxID=1257118 RepID=L8GP11_ACACF|nr:cdk10/11, putative [Acanthamoeba castellanii str. Neff]ELR14612.1 cdk10/11, putative [Acanthamoeba castellanii str. Neff]
MEDQQQPSRPRGRGPIVGLSPPSGSTKRRAHDAEDEHTPPAVGTKRARSSSGGKEREEGGATPTAGNGLPASPAPRAPSPSSSSSSSSSVPPKGASPGQRAASPQGTPLRAAAAGLPVLVAAMRSCRSVDHYERLNRIQEGAYGVVHRAKDKETGEVVALKKFKIKGDESFPVTALRELAVLMEMDHPNVVRAKEIVIGKDPNSFYLVMEFLEHDLKDLMTAMRDPFLQSEIKCLLQQLLEAIAYIHDNWYLHRDLKTSNLLLSSKGILKVADFGLARHYGDPLRPYTQPVVTLWYLAKRPIDPYRAPELLLGAKEYSWEIDMWAVGCIFAEMLCKEPLMKAQTELQMIDQIFKMLGTPNDDVWPGFSELPFVKKMKFKTYPSAIRQRMFSATTDAGFDLLMSFLAYDPKKRITAREALSHRYFTEPPLPREPGMIQTFPSLHEGTRPRPNSPGVEGGLFGAHLLSDSTDAHAALGIDPYGHQPTGFKLRF